MIIGSDLRAVLQSILWQHINLIMSPGQIIHDVELMTNDSNITKLIL